MAKYFLKSGARGGVPTAKEVKVQYKRKRIPYDRARQENERAIRKSESNYLDLNDLSLEELNYKIDCLKKSLDELI